MEVSTERSTRCVLSCGITTLVALGGNCRRCVSHGRVLAKLRALGVVVAAQIKLRAPELHRSAKLDGLDTLGKLVCWLGEVFW